jgi:hypothetical protein
MIDDVSQRFAAHVFIELRFLDGANDPDLWPPTDDPHNPTARFPIHPTSGKPTGRPTAQWYFSRLEFCNHLVGTETVLDKEAKGYKHNSASAGTRILPLVTSEMTGVFASIWWQMTCAST